MSFELWDTESANLLSDYQTEEEALVDVLRLIQARGVDAATSLALAFEDEAGETYPIAAGATLVNRARTAIPRSRMAS
jgi:hypothetical protein